METRFQTKGGTCQFLGAYQNATIFEVWVDLGARIVLCRRVEVSKFFSCCLFFCKKNLEKLAKSMRKGREICAQGRAQANSFQGKSQG